MSSPDTCLSEERFQALLTGAALETERRESEAHLTGCARCRDRLDALAGGEEPWRGGKSPSAAVPDSKPLREAMARLKAGSETVRVGPEPEPLLPGVKFQYLGDYEILEELGRGGMGVVYRARQVSLRREVAIKVMLSGQLASPAEVRRFHVEAEAAARLDHPHIVPIFEIGEHEGHHFFSMKFVEGGTLAERSSEFRLPGCDWGGALSNPDRETRNVKLAGLMAQIARAVHYAHQRGVLHRDLKPGNILLDRNGVPHVTDFGLAKLIEQDSGLTRSVAIMGTPNYLAPETAAGKAKEVTTAADVYSLGAMLYELLNGRPPFKEVTVAATLQKVIHAEPEQPRILNPAVPHDLETICLKCLEKEPARRYLSGEELAEELDRFIRGEPLLARPVRAWERGAKWARRQPALAGTLVALGTVLLLGFAGVIWKWRAEVEQRVLAQHATQKAKRATTRLEIERAESYFESGDSSKGLAYLSRLLREQPTNAVVAQRLMSAMTDRPFCVPIVPLRHGTSLNSLSGPVRVELADSFAFRRPGSIVSISFSPDGGLVITASRDGTARLWNAMNGDPVGGPLKHEGEVLGAQFSGDGQKIVTVSVDGTARLWSVSGGQPICPPLRHEGVVRFAAFSPDSRRVVTASHDKTVRIWDIESGEPIGSAMMHPKAAHFACFSPDGSRILSADEGHRARLWDAATGKSIATADHYYFSGEAETFPRLSPLLDQLATLRFHSAYLRDVKSGLQESLRLSHDDYVVGTCYSPDGRRIVTMSLDTTAGVWDATTGKSTSIRPRHGDYLSSVSFSSDGLHIATSSRDRSARFWNAFTGEPETEPMRHEKPVRLLKVSPDKRRAVTGVESDSAWLWDVRILHSITTLRQLTAAPRFARFSPDGRHLVIVDDADNVRICDARSGSFIGGTIRHRNTYPVSDARFSPDGRLLITTADDRVAQLWDTSTGQPHGPALLHPRSPTRARFAPDGRRVLTAANDGAARIWDLESGRQLFEMRHDDRVGCVEFSADGRKLVTTSEDFTARIWDAQTGRALSEVMKHDDIVYLAAFDPAGRRVAMASKDKTVRIWSVPAGVMLVPPLLHADLINNKDSVEFSRDGSRLLTVAGSVVQVWNPNTGRTVTPPLSHGGTVTAAHFSPDGKKVLTASKDGSVRLWDTETGHPVSERFRHGARVTSAEFSPDGSRVLTCSADKGLRIWEITSAPLPVPGWFADLGEALAGQQIDAQEVSSVVAVSKLCDLRQQLAGNTDQTYYGHWARWFFAEGAARAISPSSEVTGPQYVIRRVEENTLESLQEATRLCATNALAFARLAQRLITTNRAASAGDIHDAEWFSRYATNLAPSDHEAQRIRRLVLERLPSARTAVRN